MSFEAAIKIIENIERDMNISSAPINEFKISYEYLFAASDRLSEVEPFRLLSGKWLFFANGGGVLSNMAQAVIWAINQLLAGATPTQIVERASVQIPQNAVTILEICDVKGVKVTDIQPIADNVWLYPNEKLPPNRYNEEVFATRWPTGLSFASKTAALVFKSHLEPAFVDADDEASIHANDQKLYAKNEKWIALRENIRRAITLQGTGAVEFHSKYFSNEDSHILGSHGTLSSLMNAPNVFQDLEPDIAKLKEYLGMLMEFKGAESLQLAVDRLARSRSSTDNVNKAIDLGMAMEVALMHDDQNAKEEISAKLGLRAGWLLGSTVTERKEIKKRASALYSARSGAVHNGFVNSATFDVSAADELVREVLLKILRRGRFPDWSDLTFGGYG